ncbi:MAG: AI-2E family transporter [Crocinitomix sp.]|nr:AI-2E family transporter [Crocinitomix sp.]
MVKNINTIKNILVIFLVISIVYLLSALSFIFIPFVLALFVALLIMPIIEWLYARKIPYFIGVTLSFIIASAAAKGVFVIIQHTWEKMLNNQDVLKEQFTSKLTPIIHKIDNWFGFSDIEFKSGVDHGFSEFLSPSFIANTSAQLFESMLGSVSSLIVFLIFLLIILSSLPRLNQYLITLAGDSHTKKHIATFRKVKKSLTLFIKVKLISSLITGISFGLITWFFGVEFPFFWGLMAFVLNFVQYIGSILITIAVVLFGFIQIESLGLFGLYVLLLAGVQIIIGNLIEPSLMGRSFSINTLSVIIGVMLCGYVWGIAGLVLAVPLMVVTKLMLSTGSKDYLITRMISRSVEKINQ